MGGRVEPLGDQGAEDVRLKIFRTVVLDIQEHVPNVLEDRLVPHVVGHIDANIELFPEGRRSSEPLFGGRGVHQGRMIERNVGTPSQGGFVQQLGGELLSLRSPACKVRTQSGDEVIHDVERAIVLGETGPQVWKLESATNGRKSLKLLNRLSRLCTIQLDFQGTMRVPGHFPESPEVNGAREGVGDQQVVQLTALQGGIALSVHNGGPELALNDRGGQRFRLILPISPNDERSLQVMKESQELAQNERIGS